MVVVLFMRIPPNFIIFTVINSCTRLMGELIVPIVRDHSDGLNWVVNATSEDSTNIASMHLKICWDSILPFWAPIRPYLTLVGHEIDVVPSAVLSSHRFTWFISCTRTNFELEPLRLSLTWDLLRETRSIAITQSPDDANMGNLVLMSTWSAFNRSCVPGSLMRVDLTRSTDYNLQKKVDASVSVVTSTNVTAFGKASFESILESRYVAQVHNDIFGEIQRAAVRGGARWLDGFAMTNCSASILDTLPSIHVRYQNFGNLVLRPDDYVAFRSEDSRCELLLQPKRNISIVLDPLKMKDLNFRISSDSYTWEICDAL